MKLVLGLSLLSFAVLAGRAEAQVLCTLGSAPAGYESLADMPASASAQADLRKLKAALCPKGCGKVLLFANPTAPNVATVTDGQGTSKITYNPKFLASIQEELGPAGTLGVFAHELGHHLEKTASHPSWMETAWDSELRADAWASCALAKVELRPSAVQAAVRALSTVSRGDPPRMGGPCRRPPQGLCELRRRQDPPRRPRSARRADDRRQGRTQDGAQSRPRSAGRRRRVQEQSRVPQRARLRQGSLQRGPGRRSLRERHRLPGTARVQRERALRKAERRGSCRDPARGGTGTAAGATPGCRPRRPQRFSGPRRARGRPAHDDACLRACDTGRAHCVEIAVRETNQCIASVQAEPSYRACSCPNYPDGNYACYRLCSTAYEHAKSCSTPDKARDCRIEGDRCRSRCR